MEINKSLLSHYAELKLQEKRLKEELDMIKAQTLDEIRAISIDQPVQLPDVGTFSIKRRKVWTFDQTVNEIETALAEAKKEQMADGTATFEETEILEFRELKT